MTHVVGKNVTVGREIRTFEIVIVILNRRHEQKQLRYIVVNGTE